MDKIHVVKGSIKFEEKENFNVTTFKANGDFGEDVRCQVLDGKGQKKLYERIVAAEGSDLEVESLEDKGQYGFRVKLPKLGGGGGGGGFGGSRGYSGKKLSVEEYIKLDYQVSKKFTDMVDSLTSGLDHGVKAEIVRSRVSQFWILVSNNVVVL